MSCHNRGGGGGVATTGGGGGEVSCHNSNCAHDPWFWYIIYTEVYQSDFSKTFFSWPRFDAILHWSF